MILNRSETKNIHCSASSGESFVDFLSNIVVISEIEITKHLGDLVQFELPEMALPNFLHESTHFWCFHTPVGNALALVRLRTYRNLKRLKDGEDRVRYEIFDDLIRYETTLEVLRPLAEGLACFAEFDSTPSSSNVLSSPMLWTYGLFKGAGGELKSRGPNIFLLELLSRMRLSEISIERKNSLLIGDLDLSGYGHLGGYLTVKVLWNIAIKKTERAFDSDHFLTFLKSFIYDDYGFVQAIIDSQSHEHTIGNNIAQYFLERIKEFMAIDLDEAMKAHEDSINAPSVNRTTRDGKKISIPYVDAINTNKEEARNGIESVLAMYDEISDSPFLENPEEITLEKLMEAIVLKHRDIFCIGSAKCWVQVNEHKRVNVFKYKPSEKPEEFILCCNSIPGTHPMEDEGIIEFRFTSDNEFGTFVWCGGRLVSKQIINREMDAEMGIALPMRTLHEYTLSQEEKLNEAIFEDEILRVLVDNAYRSQAAGIFEIYIWIITTIDESENWRDLATRLKTGGLLKLFDNDREFIRSLVVNGNSYSVGISKDELSELLASKGLSYKKYIDALKKHENSSKLKFHAETDFMIMPYI